MATKKNSDSKKKATKAKNLEEIAEISSPAELKNFLLSVRDGMTEGTVAPIYAVSAMNHILNLPTVYDLLDKENKELARDVWLRIKQSGMQLKNPPLLFSAEEEIAAS